MKVSIRFMMFALGLLLAQAGFAQSRTISGRVISAEDGSGLPGVSVVVKGTSNGITSDPRGEYSLQAATGDVLVFSFIGMEPQEVPVGTSSTVNVTLSPDAKALGEVVVVGYGTQKRENVTGAVATVDKRVFESRPITDVARALQGTTPGLTVTTASGAIGQNPDIRLRGMIGTMSSSSGAKPLILVDNMEVPNLQMVNPDDIESVSVLKDAASASIYGSRAAWGVILITTKSGKRGAPPRISYSNNFSWSRPTNTAEIAPAAEGAELAFKAYQRTNPNLNVFGVVGMSIDQLSIQKMREWEAQYGGQDLGNEMVLGRDFEIRDGRLFFYRSWNPGEMYMRNSTPQQKHDVSISGGSEKTNYYLGLGYLGQEGVLKVNPDEFNRYNINLGINTTVTDWFDARAKVLYGKAELTRPFYFSSETYDPWYYLYRWPAVYPYGTYEGHPFRGAIAEVEQAKMNQETKSMARLSIGGTLRPATGLTIDADFIHTSNNGHEHQTGGVLSAYNFWATGAALKYEPYSSAAYNRVQYDSEWSNRSLGRTFATYQKAFGDHSFKLIAGGEAEVYEYWSHMSQRRNLMDPNRGEISLATGEMFVDNSRDKWLTMGTFGRFNYSFRDKFLLEVNGRYDGASRLSPTKKWAFFPSMSAGYVITNEPFMESVTPVLSFLKVRGSWGAVGNQNANLGDVYRLMSSSSSNWLIGNVNMVTTGTPGAFPWLLTWETVSTLDLGLDAKFFNNKLGLVFDWYQRTTSNMHSQGVTLPSTFGTGAPKRNYGELQTTGWELAVDYDHTFGNGLHVNVLGTLTDFQERITKFAETTRRLPNAIAALNSAYYEGMVLGEIWGYETDRYFTSDDFVLGPDGNPIIQDGTHQMKDGVPTQKFYEAAWFRYGPGDVKYKDLNGDGVINNGSLTVDDHGDMKVIGNSTPRFQYGMRLALDWKGIDLSLFAQGVGKRDFWANGPMFIPGFRPGEAWYAHQLDYWTPQNPNAYYPRPTDAGQSNNSRNFLPQTKYLLDISYLRMKNVTLGYTLPASITETVKMSRLRVYASGENLFEFHNLGTMPIDPEVNYTSSGLNDSSSFGRVYPYRRTMSFGLQATF